MTYTSSNIQTAITNITASRSNLTDADLATQVTAMTQDQIDDESRRIRRLRILVQLTIESIAAGDLTPEEAAGMVAATRRVALEMFPGKERAFDLLYRPKFQRVMHAVYRLQ